MNAGELVPYTTAEQLAAEYQTAATAIRHHAEGMMTACDRLHTAFRSTGKFDRFHFDVGLRYGNDSQNTTIDDMLHRMKLAAWSAIIERLNIRRLMSSKRIAELDEALEIGRPSSRRVVRRFRGDGTTDDDDAETADNRKTIFPEITPENIIAVAAGMVQSANEFLEEAVAEEYDFWRPHRNGDYKTNRNFWKLDRKIIKTWMVESWGYSGHPFRCSYSNQAHIVALDNIFHMLDGMGPVAEFKGELASAIEMSPTGNGETKYFKFKCFHNRNLHLQFKRQDLLDRFNEIAAKRDRLGQEKRRAS